ncbi:MAG: hypothetical protein F6K55_04270 [Moorea sp. SIO4A3]|nr:hypothetical protein [Moorena sp. SIO4A3]
MRSQSVNTCIEVRSHSVAYGQSHLIGMLVLLLVRSRSVAIGQSHCW